MEDALDAFAEGAGGAVVARPADPRGRAHATRCGRRRARCSALWSSERPEQVIGRRPGGADVRGRGRRRPRDHGARVGRRPGRLGRATPIPETLAASLLPVAGALVSPRTEDRSSRRCSRSPTTAPPRRICSPSWVATGLFHRRRSQVKRGTGPRWLPNLTAMQVTEERGSVVARLGVACALLRAGQVLVALPPADRGRRRRPHLARLDDVDRATLLAALVDCRLARGQLAEAAAPAVRPRATRPRSTALAGAIATFATAELGCGARRPGARHPALPGRGRARRRPPGAARRGAVAGRRGAEHGAHRSPRRPAARGRAPRGSGALRLAVRRLHVVAHPGHRGRRSASASRCCATRAPP